MTQIMTMDINNSYTNNTNSSKLLHFLSLHHSQRSRRSLFAFLSLLVLLHLAYNGAFLFCLEVPFPAKTRPEPTSFLPETTSGESRKWQSSSTTTKLSSPLMHAVKDENPPSIPKTHLPILKKSQSSVLSKNDSSIPKRKQSKKRRPMLKILHSEARTKPFSARVKEFFDAKSSKSSCKVRFFMTWIAPLESFGGRELFAIESLFKSHPNDCLIIVSESMDSKAGLKLLKPFSVKGFRVTSISPDFDYMFKNTAAESWFDRLKKGHVNPGAISLGQNLSNLLRLALVYKFGGVYLDTDVIILKSFAKLRNSIGEYDVATRDRIQLNNAVLIFDKGHPLVYKFIEEFALTFNGNKWGHNGPDLISRVVSREKSRPGMDFKVLQPMAFYPVHYTKAQTLFSGPVNKAQSKQVNWKLSRIRSESFAVHLWNKLSRKLKVEEGSIVGQIMQDRCVFCNSSAPNL